jgi:hypothetical protein
METKKVQLTHLLIPHPSPSILLAFRLYYIQDAARNFLHVPSIFSASMFLNNCKNPVISVAGFNGLKYLKEEHF